MKDIKKVLAFDLRVKIEEREGYFAAVTKPFAITAYGDTADSAEQRASEALLFLLRKYTKTPAELSDYLNHRNVKHILLDEDELERRPVVRECKQEIRLEAPAHA